MFSALIGFLLFAAFGAAMILQPQLLTRLTNLELSTPEARNEARSAYGGLAAGLALAFFIALVYSPWRQPILLTAGLGMWGAAGARGYASWLERPTSPNIWIALAVEGVLGLLFIFFAG
jgi:hypothetical protein